MAGAAMMAPLTSKLVLGQPRFGAYPFNLGVASGDPTAEGFSCLRVAEFTSAIEQ
jgi:phosphodiesterase/alkaline phosphatase D-like protein